MLRNFSVLLLALPLAAQTSSLRGPMSGYVLESNALRPILGIPGAAYLGDALLSNARAASVSPDGRSAIANLDGKIVMLRGLDNGEFQSTVLSEDYPAASLFAWNAGSTTAAIYDSGRLALAGKDGLIAVDAPEGRVSAMVLSDEGVIAAAVEGAGVMLIQRGAAPRLISRSPNVSALALAGKDLFFTDGAQGQVLRIENLAEGSDASVFASGLDGASAVAAARGKLLVAARGGKSVTAFRIATGEMLASVELSFEPSSLSALSEGLWLLNSGDSPVQLMDENLQAWFVPARTADR